MAMVYVSIGSNINRYRHITACLDVMQKHFGELIISSVYESQSVGFEGSHFFNLVIGFNSVLTVSQLAVLLRGIEHENGRLRNGPKFSSRTLDIDILTYDDCVGEKEGVLLPRDEITKNAFVLLPLMQINPEGLHPLLGKTYQQLWCEYDKDSQKLWPVEFIWQGRDLSQMNTKG